MCGCFGKISPGCAGSPVNPTARCQNYSSCSGSHRNYKQPVMGVLSG
jgi:hypothetical protein